jgi:myo-inositol-1-phosphate synthase
MHVDLGGYHISDIEFTAAFDIDAAKVGKDLGRAIWAGENNTMKFAKVPSSLGVNVHRGMTHDGLGKYLSQKIRKAPGETADIVSILRDTKTDVVVSYLPVGSEQATKWYVEQVLEAGCGFVNCIPVFIAREDYWNRRFQRARLPIVGDDIKSQVGATIVHRSLARLFHDRGVKMLRTSQLNVGGNMDFYNMLERERLESKKISKCPGSATASGPTSGWRDRPSATCRSTSSSSSRCGTRPTRRASSSTPCAAASSPSTTAWAASSTDRART